MLYNLHIVSLFGKNLYLIAYTGLFCSIRGLILQEVINLMRL